MTMKKPFDPNPSQFTQCCIPQRSTSFFFLKINSLLESLLLRAKKLSLSFGVIKIFLFWGKFSGVHNNCLIGYPEKLFRKLQPPCFYLFIVFFFKTYHLFFFLFFLFSVSPLKKKSAPFFPSLFLVFQLFLQK
ncbi:MAG: hypothetical protein CM15mP58_16740 [Burkholderiaceae bacterium]|nr:MAG: hypothetical protein CM15mP58_16740 [Burkholderiaceae bacterium]